MRTSARPVNAWTTLIAVGLVGIALAGCSASAAGSPPTTPTTPTTLSPGPSSTNGGKVDPTREATHPDPSFDYGFTILITDTGFEPHWLVSECCQTITWKNLTSSPAVVLFDHQLVHSKTIPPGGTFTWLPKNIQSVTYHDELDASRTGIIQVNQTFES